MHQLDLGAAVVEKRREAPADAEVELHPRILRVLGVHVVALLVRDHLERQLVMVAEEEPPLRPRRDLRRVVEDLDHRQRLLAAERHEHARHHREVEGHVALVALALAEVVDDVLRPLVRLGEQDAVGIARVHLGAQALQILVRARQVLAVRAVLLEEVRHGVEAEPVEPDVEPEAEHLEHRFLHLRVLVVQIRLVAEEAVPVVLAALRVVRPVRRLGVDEDDARVRVEVRVVGPDVPVALRVVLAQPGLLEPRVVGRGVVDDEVDDDADAALVRGLDERAEVLDRAVVRVDAVEVGDVVAAVAKRRGVERQEPDAVDAEPLQVVELVLEAPEVARPVVVAVEERARVDLVEDGGLEPERIGLEPVPGLAHALTLPSRSRCTSVRALVVARTRIVSETDRRGWGCAAVMRPASAGASRRGRGRRSCGRRASGSARRSGDRARGTRPDTRAQAARRRRPPAAGTGRG